MKNRVYRNLLLVSLLLSLSGWTFSQEVEVSGTIVEESNQPVPYASVVFKSIQDSTLVRGVMGKEDGSFLINLEKAVYNLEVSVVGLEPYTQRVDLSNSESKVNLGSVLIKTAVNLDEVVVKSNNSPRIALDKKVYDVTQDILVSGGSLIDVMQNIPSVQVEVDGAVSIRGDGNVQILIDGRISGLTSTASFLRTIPAASIEKIEVVTNPSSRYNSEGTGGIINVVLKKGRKKELKGSAEVFSGIRINSGLNVNINKGGEKISWYYNGGLGYSEPKATRELFLNNFDAQRSDTRQSSETILEQFYILNNLGGEWKVNPKNILSMDITYRVANLNNQNKIQYTDLNEGGITDISSRRNDEEDNNDFFQFRTDYELQLNDKGSKLEVGLVAQSTTEDSFSNINDATSFPENGLLNIDRINNDVDDRRLTASADWLHPFSETAQWEMGVRNRTTKIDNDFSVSRTSEDTSFIIPEFTDNTTYDENILAFYGQYAKTFKKFKFQLGLRTETTRIDIKTQDTQDKIRYTDIFPSGFLEYSSNDENTFRLSVSRRIQRPRRNAIVPFSSFNDSRNILIGNPSVNPTYVVLAELGYSRKFSNQFKITPTIYFRKSNDVQDFFIENQSITINGEPQEIFVTTTVNIGENRNYGLELSTSFEPLSWLNLYSEFTFGAFKQVGRFQEREYNSSGILSGGRLHFNFNIFEDLKFQLQHRFRGGYEQGQFKSKPVYRMDAGINKEFFDGKGLLTLNAKDIFNTWKFNITTIGEDFTQQLNSQIRTPQLNIAFSYLFNEKKYKGKKGQQYDKI